MQLSVVLMKIVRQGWQKCWLIFRGNSEENIALGKSTNFDLFGLWVEHLRISSGILAVRLTNLHFTCHRKFLGKDFCNRSSITENFFGFCRQFSSYLPENFSRLLILLIMCPKERFVSYFHRKVFDFWGLWMEVFFTPVKKFRQVCWLPKCLSNFEVFFSANS